jgi:hypothetical protein
MDRAGRRCADLDGTVEIGAGASVTHATPRGTLAQDQGAQ